MRKVSDLSHWVTFLGCTVMSTATRPRSLLRKARGLGLALTWAL
jgi:hypothetical protein